MVVAVATAIRLSVKARAPLLTACTSTLAVEYANGSYLKLCVLIIQFDPFLVTCTSTELLTNSTLELFPKAFCKVILPNRSFSLYRVSTSLVLLKSLYANNRPSGDIE